MYFDGADIDTTLVGNWPAVYWLQFAGDSLTAAFSSAISNSASAASTGLPSDHS